MGLSPTLCCPSCSYLSTDHATYKGRLGWWSIRCAACGSVWSSWWWLERAFHIRVCRDRWMNPGGINAVEMASLIVLRLRRPAEAER